MARKRKRKESPSMNLPLTAMIDVVFQLLIYLIVTAKPMAVFANLDVFQPSADSRTPSKKPPSVIKITVFPDGYQVGQKAVDLGGLDQLLGKMASLDKNQNILITCTAASPHAKLVQLLDLCTKNGMNNLSVVSTN